MRRFTGFIRTGIVGLAAAMASPGLTQQPGRAAIPADLSPRDAAAAFEVAVTQICVPAVTRGVRVAQLPARARAGVMINRDAARRADLGARPEETVWDLASAPGVVSIRETYGRCTVTAYGPAAAATLTALARRMEGASMGFERLATTQGKTGLAQSLFARRDRKRVQVLLDGSEPGMPGHVSRYSVCSATVFAVPEG